MGTPASPSSAPSPGLTAQSQDSSKGGEQKSVSGTVVQASADELRLDTASEPNRLKINPSTRVTIDGKDATTSELREGAQIRASYQVVGDQPTALRIEATSKAGASPGSPASPERSGGSSLPGATGRPSETPGPGGSTTTQPAQRP